MMSNSGWGLYCHRGSHGRQSGAGERSVVSESVVEVTSCLPA